VDGQRIVGSKANLRHGSVVDIGPYTFMFRSTRPVYLPPAELMSLECEAELIKAGLATFHLPLASSSLS
jgi:hypothetical protein